MPVSDLEFAKIYMGFFNQIDNAQLNFHKKLDNNPQFRHGLGLTNDTILANTKIKIVEEIKNFKAIRQKFINVNNSVVSINPDNVFSRLTLISGFVGFVMMLDKFSVTKEWRQNTAYNHENARDFFLDNISMKQLIAHARLEIKTLGFFLSEDVTDGGDKELFKLFENFESKDLLDNVLICLNNQLNQINIDYRGKNPSFFSLKFWPTSILVDEALSEKDLVKRKQYQNLNVNDNVRDHSKGNDNDIKMDSDDDKETEEYEKYEVVLLKTAYETLDDEDLEGDHLLSRTIKNYFMLRPLENEVVSPMFIIKIVIKYHRSLSKFRRDNGMSPPVLPDWIFFLIRK